MRLALLPVRLRLSSLGREHPQMGRGDECAFESRAALTRCSCRYVVKTISTGEGLAQHFFADGAINAFTRMGLRFSFDTFDPAKTLNTSHINIGDISRAGDSDSVKRIAIEV